MGEYYAHTPTEVNPHWHELKKHLIGVADLASSWGRHDEEKTILYLIGLLHDLGKYQQEFQDYLLSANEGKFGKKIPHSIWGAYLIYKKLQLPEGAFVIDGHHAGLPDKSTLKDVHFQRFEDESIDAITRERDQSEASTLFEIFKSDTRKDFLDFKLITDNNPFSFDVRTRYYFSCLVDADWLNTEQHMDPPRYSARTTNIQSCKLNIEELLKKIEQHYLFMSENSEDTEVNRIRNTARDECLGKANSAPGFFSLVLPTGLGKTLTSFSWALHHIKANRGENEFDRIIIVLPYLNIIDQTVLQLRKIFGDKIILEHHSSVDSDYDDEKDYDPKKLACENWEYPIIVTTTVQFFESLFSNKKSKCRKIHNIANSVIIFDEVQTLPKESITPTLHMLQDVQKYFNCSFLFCTATMPAFTKRNGFTQGIDKIKLLIEKPERYYVKRVEYSFVNELRTVSMEKLLSLLKKQARSTLVVLNTKKDALELFTKIGGEWDERFHLSTSMFPRHRKIILKRIRKSLKSGRKILVVTTQLIEAGVDLDFPTVFRALGPLDSIIQAAGRCNREGADNKGYVYIFNLEGAGMPVDSCYRAASAYVEHFLKNKSKDGLLNDQIMHSTDIFDEYFDGLLKNFINADKANIEDSRRGLRFKEVAEKYHIIDNVTKPIFVKCFQEDGKIIYIREARDIYKKIKNKPFLSIEDYRKLQPYLVQLYPNALLKAESCISRLPSDLLVWEGFYSRKTGLGEPGFEDLIV